MFEVFAPTTNQYLMPNKRKIKSEREREVEKKREMGTVKREPNARANRGYGRVNVNAKIIAYRRQKNTRTLERGNGETFY